MWNYVRNWAAQMAQDIGDPPNVSGWPAITRRRSSMRSGSIQTRFQKEIGLLIP